MREIKFRAWHKELKLMGEVLTLQFGQNKTEQIEVDLHLESLTYLTDPIGEFDIMQFTGLKDKNGVGIYDGDIWKRDSFIATVEFKHSGWQLIKTESSGCYQYPSFYSNAKLGEVIGNIHENPELLCAKK